MSGLAAQAFTLGGVIVGALYEQAGVARDAFYDCAKRNLGIRTADKQDLMT